MESIKGFRKFFSQKMITLIVLLVIVIVTFSVLSKGVYLKAANLRAILSLMAVTGLLTLGVGCLIVSGNIDLSTGANGTMCGMLLALFLQTGVPWPIAVLACLAVGMLVGVINAFLINSIGFQPFIATMAVASVAQGLTYVFCDGKPVPIKNEIIGYVGTGRIFDVIPVSIIILILGFIVYGLMLSKSKFGRSIYMVGGNRQAARLSGIHPVKMSYILFMNSGMLAALAGMLLAARLKSGTVGGIANAQFSGMTAAMLGGISFGGGTGSFAGVFVGLLIMNGFNNGMTVLGVLSFWQTFASGALLIFALIIDYLNGRRRMSAETPGT